MNISEAGLDKHFYVNTVKEGKKTFLILDQKRAGAVIILKERCGFPSGKKNFIQALECNSIDGANFSGSDINIDNKIYRYSKGAVMGRFKHPRKSVKRDRTTENIAAPSTTENHETLQGYIYMDINILFVNKTAFSLAISREIRFIYCKPMASSVSKRVQNALEQIKLDYQARRF